MAGQFDNKVALVTGAGSGIGRATAERFAREGATVIVVDVSVESGEETAQLISATGRQVLFIKTDVSRAEDVEAMVKIAVARYGRLDCAHITLEFLGRELQRLNARNRTGIGSPVSSSKVCGYA